VAVAAGCGGHARDASWPEPNADDGGTRSAAGTEITSHTVGRLKLAWRFVFPEQPTFAGVVAAQPLVLDGRVYVQTLHSNVYALDARTGSVVWRRSFARESGGPNGLASANGVVFGSTDVAAFALSASTGRMLWLRRLTTARAPLDIAPTVANGIVYTSTAPIRAGGRGVIVALAARSGRPLWRFDTIRGRFAVPSEAAGGGAWWSPTVDAAGRLFVGVANPLPWGGTRAHPNGGAYAGRALYTDSLLVLDGKAGKLVWFDQVTRHDVRDYDFALPPVLATVHGRQLAIGSGKAGLVVAWDRARHVRLWTAKVGRHLHDTGPLTVRRETVCPGLYGGVLTPMAYSHGRVYVASVDLCMRGSAVGYEPLASVDPTRGSGRLTALDAASGRELWTRRLPSPDFGCATAAADLVFTATFDGRVYAFRAADGRRLWTTRAPAGINACPTVAGRDLFVAAGAEPTGIASPTPQLIAYRLP